MSIKKIIIDFLNKVKAKKLHMPDDCSIDFRTKIVGTECEGSNKILKGTELSNCFIGRASFIGRNCAFVDTIIGRYCSIGEEVKLIYGNHPVNQIVSTYPAFYSSKAQYGFSYVEKTIFEEFSTFDNGSLLEIGNDVWIGSSVRILSGVRIGDGAVIAAGSLVVNDVQPYSVVMGVPAKCKKMRFTAEQIDKLQSIRWWEKGEDWLKENAMHFSNIESFLREIHE